MVDEDLHVAWAMVGGLLLMRMEGLCGAMILMANASDWIGHFQQQSV